MRHCGHCHACGAQLVHCLDGEDWCPRCCQYRRYRSHGWTRHTDLDDYRPECPEIAAPEGAIETCEEVV